MRKSLQLLSGVAFLAVPLLAMPAFAQTTQGGPPPGTVMMQQPPGDTSSEGTEGQLRGRHQLHEQMEELKAEHDRLQSQCLDAKGQDATECQEKMRSLHEQMRALHEQKKAMHQARHGSQGGHNHQGAPNGGQNGAPNNVNPPVSPPPAPSDVPSQMPGGQ
jgi:hypothetical protein